VAQHREDTKPGPRLEHPLLLFLPAADALDGERLAEL
jgi:hypothetical protein